jgi:lipoate-protein ligase A
MKYLDLTLPTPAENLALDEALLDACDAGDAPPVLRFWEAERPFVVLGYANHAATEVNLAACRAAGVPVLRRTSGGGTVVQGPGCLSYALVCRLSDAPAFASITQTNVFILGRHQVALQHLLGQPVRRQGDTDLVIRDRKCSGNSQRRKRDAVLFHGTFLLHFDLAAAERLLPLPARQPPYRANRSHADFLMNLELPAAAVKTALRDVWEAQEELRAPPLDRMEALVREKYSQSAWNLKF